MILWVPRNFNASETETIAADRGREADSSARTDVCNNAGRRGRF